MARVTDTPLPVGVGGDKLAFFEIRKQRWGGGVGKQRNVPPPSPLVTQPSKHWYCPEAFLEEEQVTTKLSHYYHFFLQPATYLGLDVPNNFFCVGTEGQLPLSDLDSLALLFKNHWP